MVIADRIADVELVDLHAVYFVALDRQASRQGYYHAHASIEALLASHAHRVMYSDSE
jgi:hypothetical protein